MTQLFTSGWLTPSSSTYTGKSKNIEIWATLWMSRNGTSLTTNIEILEYKGRSISLVYYGR
ncbi:hypothetical protein J6590_056653 [Homalodisca vitripennis]|nr:hypothetical protein J6590_056653 [Homalodisca vitripennis]